MTGFLLPGDIPETDSKYKYKNIYITKYSQDCLFLIGLLYILLLKEYKHFLLYIDTILLVYITLVMI